ncbi:MAG: type II secretion system protein GspK [Candidatus Omnitrophica bacterium]|nr:type II secretion system protein GspK [Candidatus Omnitrophota bacterium]
MKFIGFCLRRNNKSGIILIVVLWILAILSVLAIGLGRAARIDLALTKHRIGKLKADFLTWAAVNYSINQIRLNAETQAKPGQPAVNTLYQCGVDLRDGKTTEEIFKNIKLKDGSFNISYVLKEDNNKGQVCYGFQDEERRININTIDASNYKILKQLFMLLNVEDEKAEALAAEIADWRDPDSEKINAQYGAEKDDYLALAKPYASKDGPFDILEELLLIKDMTPEIFSKIKEYLTVFPQSDMNFTVNINTAPPIVLKALFRFLAEQNINSGAGEADSVVEKIVAYRRGDDGIACTADDRTILTDNSSSLGLFGNESALYQSAINNNYLKGTSAYFRVCAKGMYSQYAVSSDLETVISGGLLIFWKRK